MKTLIVFKNGNSVILPVHLKQVTKGSISGLSKISYVDNQGDTFQTMFIELSEIAVLASVADDYTTDHLQGNWS